MASWKKTIMREGYYQDAKHNISKIPRIACVMCVYIPQGQVESYQVCSNINKDQYYPFTENKLESVRFTIACYEHYKPGIDFDLYIVDNNSQDKETLEFLKNCQYQAYHRENQGFS